MNKTEFTEKKVCSFYNEFCQTMNPRKSNIEKGVGRNIRNLNRRDFIITKSRTRREGFKFLFYHLSEI